MSARIGIADIMFSAFDLQKDMGFFGWQGSKCKSGYKTADSMKKNDIIKFINMKSRPNRLVDVKKENKKLLHFPKRFLTNLRPQRYESIYPHVMPSIVPLYIAVKKYNVNLGNIDFVFGGSTLGILATQEIQSGRKYVMQKVKDVVHIFRHKKYTQDYAASGFQFERLLSGSNFDDIHDTTYVEHLQLILIGGRHQVLFCAEADAIDSEGKLVEIKSGNPRYILSTKTIFQMLSQGASSLVYAIKDTSKSCGQLVENLTEIRQISIGRLIESELLKENVEIMLSNILNALTKIKKDYAKMMKEGKLYELQFGVSARSREVLVTNCPGISCILPPTTVVDDLFRKRQKCPMIQHDPRKKRRKKEEERKKKSAR